MPSLGALSLSSSLLRELKRFLIAGMSAVMTDLLTYQILLTMLAVSLSKGMAFCAGSTVAFLVNKYWTFTHNGIVDGDKGHDETFDYVELSKFICLYCVTLMANVVVNGWVISKLEGMVYFAFLMATATSTILNFIGMKFWVFK